ncbi:TPA: fimbria/pilus outer membrane usher protein [Klebsiella quasipneumoniae subsp. similipneumoniae]
MPANKQFSSLHLHGRCGVLHRKTVVALLLPTLLMAQSIDSALADDVVFDTGALQAQGLDSGLATRFQHGDMFPPGISVVELRVNGQERGRLSVRFDKNGHLCPDTALLRQAGLKMLSAVSDASNDETSTPCVDLSQTWPQFTVQAEPGDSRLTLVVPQDALDPTADNTQWQHNGAAALLNYSVQYMGSQSQNSSLNYWQMQTEAGFNAGDWVIRSNQNVYRYEDETKSEYQNAYLQRTFAAIKSTLQAGQIPISSGLFGIGQVLGLQMIPEQALYPKSGAAIVSGIADTTSVIEVRQLGVPIYHTTVPAGPFNLSGFSLLNTRTDLIVEVNGTDGSKRSFVVPASAYAREGVVATPGVTWGVGRYDQKGVYSHPMVAVVSKGFQTSERSTLLAGGLWANNYQAVSASFSATFLWGTNAILQNTVARATSRNTQGTQTSLNINQPLNDNLSLTLTSSHQDDGYREFSEAQLHDSDNYARNKNQYGAGIIWTQDWLGSLSLSTGRSSRSQGYDTTWTQLSWGRQFGRTTLNINASRNESGGYYGRDDRVYVTLQFPLGNESSLRSFASHSRDGYRYGSQFSQRLSQDRNWSLAVTRDEDRQQNSATGTFSTVTRWSNLNGSLSADSGNTRNLSLQATGSVVGHDHGVTFAPYQVRDTFGIAKVGKKAGVRLETPAGPVWTDNNGYAVIPSLTGWNKTMVEVDTRSLGKRADVMNGSQEVAPARGSVSKVSFETVSTRRVLVSVRNPDGSRLTSGASVYDLAGTFITVVDDDGNIFLPDARPGMVVLIDMKTESCSIALNRLPEEAAEDTGLYETLNSECRQTGG